jgi:predicted nucleotidyltransferase
MTRDEALARLRSHEHELRSSGINALFLFGSTSRNETRDDSDVDLLCDLNDSDNLGLLEFIRLKDRMSDVLALPVDLIERRTVRPRISERIEPELVRVF